jgi:hypothetical protein
MREELEEVGQFAAIYANDPKERTSGRDADIARAALNCLNKVKTCSCPDWYMDTLAELVYLLKKLRMSKYILLSGAVLYQFSRSELTTTVHNLDDDRAELFLGADSRKLELFEEYPKTKSGEWVGITEARFSALCEQFNVGPAIRVEESQAFNAPVVKLPNAPVKLTKAEQTKADKAAAEELAKLAELDKGPDEKTEEKADELAKLIDASQTAADANAADLM